MLIAIFVKALRIGSKALQKVEDSKMMKAEKLLALIVVEKKRRAI